MKKLNRTSRSKVFNPKGLQKKTQQSTLDPTIYSKHTYSNEQISQKHMDKNHTSTQATKLMLQPLNHQAYCRNQVG